MVMQYPMSEDVVETRQGVEAMASFGGMHTTSDREDEGGRLESPKRPEENLMNGVTEGAGPENKTLKLEIINVEGDNNSRSDQGSVKTSPRVDEVEKEGVKRGRSRRSETEGSIGGLGTPQRLRLDRSTKSNADSGTKPRGEEINENVKVVESSMFKQVKFENGASISQSGLTDADDRVEASGALAAVLEVHEIPKEVVGLAADFPGEIGVGSKKQCHICKKPETAKHIIICDKCQQSFHLSCAKLKPKQAVDIENEHWQCEFCGPELGWQCWALGRVTSQHDRKQADARGVEPQSRINTLKHPVVTFPDTDTAVEDDGMRTQLLTKLVIVKGGDHGGAGDVGNVRILKTKDEEVVVSLSKENVIPERRSRRRPSKGSVVLKGQVTTSTMEDLGDRASGIGERQLALNFGINASVSPPSALGTAMSTQTPLVGATEIMANREIRRNTTAVTLSDEDFQSKDREAMLEDLRRFIASMNGNLGEGWHVIKQPRTCNSLVSDKIFISPDNQKFRSRPDVARFLGLAVGENPKKSTKLSDVHAQDAAQKLENPLHTGVLTVEGYRSSRETLPDIKSRELVEVSEKPIVENIPVFKENRAPPPAGELLTRRVPAELVGDTLQVWEFLCRFSEVLGLKSPLTFEDLETELVNLGPPEAVDALPNVEVQNSSDPRSKEDSVKVIAEAAHEAKSGISRNVCAEVTGVSLESDLTPVGQAEDFKAEDFKAEDPGFTRTNMIANGMELDKSIIVEAGDLPQSTCVQEIGDLAPGPAESLGKEVPPVERAVAFSDGTLTDHFVMISRTHIPLLKLLLNDLQSRITGGPNVSKIEEPKKRGRKPLYEAPQDISVPEFPIDLPMNEVTWPELVRRYLITLIEVEKYGDLTELRQEHRKWLMRCLEGDGGVPCGALYTVVGVESDAQVLAEAEKELAVRLPKADGVMEEEDDLGHGFDKLPQWVEVLKPVVKMATNVGSRIRIKVKEALELDPPEWARQNLEWSISKDVFKGNACGPTKKAVIEVLKHYDVSPPCESPTHKIKTKTKRTVPSVDQLMQRCRVVLRTVADADKTGTFSILIGGSEGHGSGKLQGMVARPLDFRTIDARLAAGAYGGSVDAFADDVRQIWRNVESLLKGGEVMELASNLSLLFEDLLQKQVLNFMSGIPEVKSEAPKSIVAIVLEEGKELINAPLTRSATTEKPDESKLKTAPWQDNDTCRVCGVDEDYESIMLCDKCDAEYHTYCLNPPLEKVPDGNWFCPECVALDKGFPDRPSGKDGEVVEPESLEGEEEQFPADRNMDDLMQTKEKKEVPVESAAQCLLKQVEMKEYWQLRLSERLQMLKFLCNESLKTTQVRTHLEKSLDLANDLQQQLSSLHAQREDAVDTVEDEGRQRKALVEVLKTVSQSVKGTEASNVDIDTWFSRSRHHSSGVVSAEDNMPGVPRHLNFDADGKVDENTSERFATPKGVPESGKEGMHDAVTVIDAVHDDPKSDEEIKIATASNCAIVSEKSVNEVSASADPSFAVLSSKVVPNKRKNDVEVLEGDLMIEVGLREANAPEGIMARNSKRAKLDECGTNDEPQVGVTKSTATLDQTENLPMDKNKGKKESYIADRGGVEAECILASGNRNVVLAGKVRNHAEAEGGSTFVSSGEVDILRFVNESQDEQTAALCSDSKLDEVIRRDAEVEAKKVLGSDSPGAKNFSVNRVAIDLGAEPGLGVALRSSRLSSDLPSSSGAKIGTFGLGLPPRTPKRKPETTSSSETHKKLRMDATFGGDGISVRKIPSKDVLIESQGIPGTAQGIPALGEVIDDPHRGEGFLDIQRQGLGDSSIVGSIPSSALLKLDAEIVKIELKLYNTTLRRDHLGTDDIGRDYWVLSGSNQTPMLVVSEYDVIGRAEFEGAEGSNISYMERSGRINSDGNISQIDHNEGKTRWWTYNNEASLDSLMAWLNPRVKVEQALKNSICHWRESVLTKFHKTVHGLSQGKVNSSPLGNDTDGSLQKGGDIAQTSRVAPKRFPTLKATSILQMRYGSASFSDRVVHKKSVPVEGRLIRCSCLEPLWKFKWHCQACHETYESSAELESHKNVCPDAVAIHSLGKKKQKGSGKEKKSLTPENGKKTGTCEKGNKKSKSATPKKDETRRLMERDATCVRICEENSWMSQESSEPTLHRHGTRSKTQAPHSFEVDVESDVNGNWAVKEESVDDAFFLSDFQDDVQNLGVDNIEQEDLSMGFGSFSSLLQDEEWEANLRPDRSELKRKKHGSGKKSTKQPPIQGASEMALANFDYASLPMTFSTPDSTRDRILQIGCIADQGPTFAPALHFAPAFDPSLMIQPRYSGSNEGPTDAVEFPGSSPLPFSQNGSPTGDLNTRDFVDGGLDAVSWYDPQTSGGAPPDTGDTEPVVHPGSGVAWDYKWAELVGLPKTEYEEKYVSHMDGGYALNVSGEEDIPLYGELQPNCDPNINGEGLMDSRSDEPQPRCTLNATGEETVPLNDELRSTSDLEPQVLAPVSVAEALPAQDLEVLVERAAAEVSAVVPSSTTMKKPSKKFAAPESSLRPLIGEQFGVLVGLKMRLLDMEAAMGVDALVPSKSAPARRRAWRSLVKSAQCIFEMTKAVIILEQMVRADCLKRSWCYWSSLSAAARSATLSTLALRIFAFDAAVTYKKDKVTADDLRRPSTVKKSHKKIHVQVPLSSKKKKANKVS